MVSFFLKYLSLNKIFFFFFKEKNLKKSQIHFNIIQYDLFYEGSSLFQILVPLVNDLFQIFNDIEIEVKKKNVISIVSTLNILDSDNQINFIHSLSKSNKLYNLENYNEWFGNIFFNLVEKLEIYNSFKKIVLTVNIKKINSL
jgi:hypothetical protein